MDEKQYTPRLKEKYKKEIIPGLMEKFAYRNINQVPKLVKISLNMGLGEAINNPKLLESAVEEMKVISGQKPVITRARKSIASFKVRAGNAIGCTVTVRGDRAYELLDRLITLALPRVRDFKGVSRKGFDGRGNYTMGIKEQIIFPEVDYDKVEKIHGMNITIVTSARTDEEAFELLKRFDMPFRRR